MNDIAQEEFDFRAPDEDGYAIWQWERREAVARFAKLWGLPLDADVRVTLRDLDQEFGGRLELVRYPSRMDRAEPLSLRVGSIPFLSTEIERCSRMASAGGAAP